MSCRSGSWIIAAVLALGALAGCNKPAEEDCRKAIRNMQRLLGTDKLHSAQNVESGVRSCRGASTKKSVECAIQAQTLDALKQCPFWHEQGAKDDPAPGGDGSAGSGSAGSAAPREVDPGLEPHAGGVGGDVPQGSGAPPTEAEMNKAAEPVGSSGSGSAAAPATGSAAAPAAGSAVPPATGSGSGS